MQLTRFDRWLREKFVYETHISTLSPAQSLPRGISAVSNSESAGKRYKHLYVAKSTKAADLMLLQLRENNQMYSTQVVDKRAWYVPFIAPKSKSVTWWVISTVIMAIFAIFALSALKMLTENPAFRASFMDAFKMFTSK